MKLKDKYDLERFVRHCKELEALGAEDGVKAYWRLVQLENRAHKLAEDCCNYLDADSPEANRRAAKIMFEVERVFSGMPVGFFINYDPRGYALKIKPEYNNVPSNPEFPPRYGEAVHYKKTISYTDFGDYGILAPDFGG